MSKDSYQAELLGNRLAKRYRHLRKWARRTDVSCYRLYDRDIPEIPLSIDLYADEDAADESGLFCYVCLYERPYEKDEAEEEQWLEAMKQSIVTTLQVPYEHIAVKTRKIQHGENQYGKNSGEADAMRRNLSFVAKEQHARFFINLYDYLDTGLFLDHRVLRSMVRQNVKGRRVLNLFSYTGSFSVYAAQGRASLVQSVDLSNTYLEWAKKNMELNGFKDKEKYLFTAQDVSTFLTQAAKEKQTFDMIILDPPTFSNSKKTKDTLDINRDYAKLINMCLDVLSEDGTLYFSTNSRRLSFDESLIAEGYKAVDISARTIPEDFRNSKIHRVWEITSETVSQ